MWYFLKRSEQNSDFFHAVAGTLSSTIQWWLEDNKESSTYYYNFILPQFKTQFCKYNVNNVNQSHLEAKFCF